MPELCNAEHPEQPGVLCDVRTDQHKRYHSNRERGLAWPDTSYPAPVPRTSSGRKKSTKAVLADFLRGPGPSPSLPDPGADRPAMHHDPDPGGTETVAAALVRPQAGTMREQVLDLFIQDAEGPDRGFTDPEIAAALEMYQYTAAPRRKELHDMGWVVDSGERRLTVHQRPAIVWKLSARARG